VFVTYWYGFVYFECRAVYEYEALKNEFFNKLISTFPLLANLEVEIVVRCTMG
jgi:hypothetical protein